MYFSVSFTIYLSICKYISLCQSISYSVYIFNHPFQYVYYNSLVKNNIKKNFELDYWGVSNLHTLNYLIDNYNRDEYFVFAAILAQRDLLGWQSRSGVFLFGLSLAAESAVHYIRREQDTTKAS